MSYASGKNLLKEAIDRFGVNFNAEQLSQIKGMTSINQRFLLAHKDAYLAAKKIFKNNLICAVSSGSSLFPLKSEYLVRSVPIQKWSSKDNWTGKKKILGLHDLDMNILLEKNDDEAIDLFKEELKNLEKKYDVIFDENEWMAISKNEFEENIIKENRDFLALFEKFPQFWEGKPIWDELEEKAKKLPNYNKKISEYYGIKQKSRDWWNKHISEEIRKSEGGKFLAKNFDLIVKEMDEKKLDEKQKIDLIAYMVQKANKKPKRIEMIKNKIQKNNLNINVEDLLKKEFILDQKMEEWLNKTKLKIIGNQYKLKYGGRGEIFPEWTID